MKRIYIIWMWLLVSLPVVSQDVLGDAIDKQLLVLKETPRNTVALKEVSMLYLNQANFDKAIEYADNLLEIGLVEEDYSYSVIYAHIYLGQALMMKDASKSVDAYNHLKKAEKIGKEYRLDSALCSVYNGLGLYAVNIRKDYTGSLQNFYEGIEAAKRSGYKRLHGILLCNIAGVYHLKKDTTGLVYTQECYEKGHELQDPYLSFIGSITTAYMLLLKRDYQTALKYAQEAEFLMSRNNFNDEADIYALNGYILKSLRRRSEAEAYFQKALSVWVQGNISSVLNAYLGYAIMSMENGDLPKAIALLQEGIKRSEDYPTAVYRSELILKLSECYENRGQYDEALAYYKQYKVETDSIFNVEKERSVGEIRLKYDMERAENDVKQSKLELLEKEKKIQMMMSLLFCVLIASSLLYYLYYRKRKLYQAIVRQNQEAIRRERLLQERISVMEASWEPRQTGENENNVQTKYASSSLNEEKKQDLFQALERLMTEKYCYKDNLLTKEKVAELLGSNRTYLSQIINEQTGKTFTQYINDYRIQEAVRLLSDPTNQTPLKAVSADLGFNSMTTFYKQFQAATGMTPTQYRNQVVGLA